MAGSRRANFIIGGMSVFALGLNHTTAPLDLRGRFAFAPRAAGAGAARPSASAATTRGRPRSRSSRPATAPSCTSRAERRRAGRARRSTGWPASAASPSADAARARLRAARTRAAARHAFRVASGPRFDGARRAADPRPDEAGGARGRRAPARWARTLHQMFQRSFAVAKEVRSSTEIGAHSISMAAAAVRLASQLFEDLRETQRAVRRRRRDDRAGGDALRGARSRSRWRWPTARSSAARSWPAASAPRRCALADLPARLHEFDVVVSCTASSLPIIGLGAVERALKARTPPADVHGRPGGAARHRARGGAPVRRLPLHRRRPVGAGADAPARSARPRWRRPRRSSRPACRASSHWLDQRGSVPLIQALHAQADDWRAAEIARARKLLARRRGRRRRARGAVARA